MKRRIIKSESFNKHWMRFNYKTIRKKVAQWNKFVDEVNRVSMNPKFSVVKSTIETAAKDCDLHDDVETGRIFLAAMSWINHLEFAAMKNYTKFGGDDLEEFDVGQMRFVQKRFENLSITLDTLEPFFEQFVKKNPHSKRVCEQILKELADELFQYEWSFDSFQKHFEKKGSASKTKDKAFYDVMNLLNKNSESKEKIPENVCSAAGSIFSCIYCLNEPESGWIKYSCTQYSNYKKRAKSPYK